MGRSNYSHSKWTIHHSAVNIIAACYPLVCNVVEEIHAFKARAACADTVCTVSPLPINSELAVPRGALNITDLNTRTHWGVLQ